MAPAFTVVLVGDELLSGRRRDGHLPHVIGTLAERGLELAGAYLVGDDPPRLTRVLEQAGGGADVVFCFGGIGATPDDCTRQAAAAAAGVALVRHPAAVAEIEARFGEAAYPNRIRMAELPAGSTLIPNPYNRIPGFSLGDRHFFPGFPVMAWPMLEWVLDTRYAHLRAAPVEQFSLTVQDVHESDLLAMMEELAAAHRRVRLSSLPHFDGERRAIVFGLRGRGAPLAAARADLEAALAARGLDWREGER